MSERLLHTHVLTVDDDPDVRALVDRFLSAEGARVTQAPGATEALAAIDLDRPDIVLLDVLMPGTNGFELCASLQAIPELCAVPVVFLTAMDSDQDKARALAAGGAGFVTKPFDRASLTTQIEGYLKTSAHFCAISESERSWSERLVPEEFVRFKQFLLSKIEDSERVREHVESLRPSDLYTRTSAVISSDALAASIAEFLGVDRVHSIPPDAIELGVLPTPFCRSNLVVPVTTATGPSLVIANPFNWQLLDTVERYSKHASYRLQIAEPRAIIQLLSGADNETAESAPGSKEKKLHTFETAASSTMESADELAETSGTAVDNSPVAFIANNIIVSAAMQRASDIHIEPKESTTVVRFRVDGDMRDFVTLKRVTGGMLISRLKVLSGLDISERRKPQDGSMEAVVQNRRFKLRLATTSGPEGESLIMRLLEAEAKPKPLHELGMTTQQEAQMLGFANRAHGLICIVGPTGSGKTTTIYSLISQVDADKRSIISIEDPVEYRIAKANQQQVNEKAGVTFDSLLRSVVRQDPDVLFLGEIRDPYSAKMSMDFASTGHLTITSLHTTNSTTAIFRFERLGVSREVMAEAVLAIVAQRLIKRLCPKCRSIDPISDEERMWLEPFTDDIPETVAHPVGCSACSNTGYAGREAVNEIFAFDSQIQQMVRNNVSVPLIREFVRKRKDFLLYDHAISKLRAHTICPRDVWSKVLVEEAVISPDDEGADEGFYQPDDSDADAAPTRPAEDANQYTAPPLRKAPPAVPAQAPAAATPALILIVDDDPDARLLLERVLRKAEYEVIVAPDGGTALLEIGRRGVDLIISDLNMPGLDGFTLLQIVSQQGVEAPVMFLTASDTAGDEAKGFALGAADFMHKPIQQEVLLARVAHALVLRGGGAR